MKFITPEEIEPGKTYACKFKAEMMLDAFGRPPGLADVPMKGPGMYEGFGLIRTRDLKTRLFEIDDIESNRKMVVPFDQCWDIDFAEIGKQDS